MYPLTVQADYTELRYSLRSVEKWLPDVDEVIIVGSRMPDWITGVTQIDLGDVPGKKQLSIRRKILAALKYTDEILFMNDDVYLMQGGPFPYYYFGGLKDYTETGSKELYKQLKAMGKPTKCFDGHFPIVYDRRFAEVSSMFAQECIIKSMYCNYLGIEGVQMPDNKILKGVDPVILRGMVRMKPSFSTGQYSIGSALVVLGELFGKSKFELW